MDELFFKDKSYYDKAMNLATSHLEYTGEKKSYDAFLLMLKGIPADDLDNYLLRLSLELGFSQMDCYKLTQGQDLDKLKLTDGVKKNLLDIAYKCIELDKYLGSVTDGPFYKLAFMSHCLYEGKLAEIMANKLGLNGDIAKKLGILHDIGRKRSHRMDHTVKGFEMLIDEGWDNESLICITHSYISEDGRGHRCANMDASRDGFYLDDDGNPCWEEGYERDDMTDFLDSYTFSLYDTLINVSDLMCVSEGITAPYRRMLDIESRKAPDPRNKNFFRARFINTLNELLVLFKEQETYHVLRPTKDLSDADIDAKMREVSEKFYNVIKKEL